MSVSFNLGDYKLTCQAQENRLFMRLQPLEIENKNVVRFLYQAQYRDPDLPEGIKYLFNESTSDWFRYIDFNREKCFDLNLNAIKEHEESEQKSQIEHVELPFSFKIKVMEGLKEPRFKIFGSMQLFSKELKLEKLLHIKEKETQDLRKSLIEKDQLIQELRSKNYQLNQQNEDLRRQNSRLLQQQLPRKRMHLDEQVEQGAMFQNNSGFPYGNNSQSDSSNKTKQSQKRNLIACEIAQQNFSVQNQPSLSNPALSEAFQQIDRKINEIPDVTGNKTLSKHSQTFYNRPSTFQTKQTQFSLNETRNSNSSLLSSNLKNGKQNEEQPKNNKLFQNTIPNKNEAIKNPEPNVQIQASNPLNIQKPVQTVEKKMPQPSNKPQITNYPQIIALNGQILAQDKVKMVKQFAAKKCHMQVGYDQNGNAKHGFCCVFCEKIFKEDEFLSKHFFSRHSEISNQTTYEYLSNVLINFKRRRQQKILAFEANHAAERRLAARSQLLQGRP